MSDKDLRKLGRLELVDILCRQREMIDELSEENQRLQARAEEAEKRCGDYAAAQQDDAERRAENDALRSDMEHLLEMIEAMADSAPSARNTEAAHSEAQAEAEEIITQARAQSAALLAQAQQEIARQRADFARQCEELANGYLKLDNLFDDHEETITHDA